MTDSGHPNVSRLFGFRKIKLRHLPRDTAVVRAGIRIVYRQEYLVKSDPFPHTPVAMASPP